MARLSPRSAGRRRLQKEHVLFWASGTRRALLKLNSYPGLSGMARRAVPDGCRFLAVLESKADQRLHFYAGAFATRSCVGSTRRRRRQLLALGLQHMQRSAAFRPSGSLQAISD
jgi:hypothetical protein